MKKSLLVFLCLAGVLWSGLAQGQNQGQNQGQGQNQARPPRPVPGQMLGSDVSVHDPVMIRQDGIYYVFFTGNGISMYSSTDMKNWKMEKQVFDEAPAWVIEQLPRFRNSMWAPDINLYNGNYYLFYSVSVFGRNTSAIGVARNKTLHTDSPDYKWEDLGCVIQSVPGRDHWNAIDPNLVVDEEGVPWLDFGSFWDGMKLVRLKDDLTGVTEPQEWYTIARRFRDPFTSDNSAGEGQIEAPFIFKRDSLYYLFVSWDKCCSGVNSTYKVAVGRSSKVTGPYLDRNNTDMAKGGGTIVVEGDKDYPGVGHQAVVTFDTTDFLVYHGYDAKDNGRSKLIIKKISWDEYGWPVIEKD